MECVTCVVAITILIHKSIVNDYIGQVINH